MRRLVFEPYFLPVIHILVEEGMATRSEARPVEMEFRAAVLQVDLAELEMQIIESKLADPSAQ